MEEIDLKEVLNYFKSKILWIILAVVLVVGAGNIYQAITRKPLYSSDTSVILVSNNTNQSSANLSELQINKNLVSTYTEIIKSRKVLEPVIENLELANTYTELKSRVGVTAIGDTQLIKISVSDRNPDIAKQTADEIARVFIREVKEIYKLDNVKVVDKAVIATKPYNINYVKDNAIFVAIGVVLSCGVVFLIFYFDTTIKTAEEIENKLGLTVIGTVPKVKNK
jgi:capsular polysaccharide biosynthesis protein